MSTPHTETVLCHENGCPDHGDPTPIVTPAPKREPIVLFGQWVRRMENQRGIVVIETKAGAEFRFDRDAAAKIAMAAGLQIERDPIEDNRRFLRRGSMDAEQRS